jgi:HTH-type transcriptional regulator, sugar sensing transcriptional regulator
MNNNKLVRFLQDLSLSVNEAKVYFAALSLGPSTIQKIAQAAEIKRTTAYSVVESLQYKGLMNIEVKGLKRLFVAENPEKLESILESRRAVLKDLLPEFEALYNLKGGESFIRYYEGLEAMKSVYEGLLRDIKPHEDYLVVSHTQYWFQLDPTYFQNFIERRAKLNIKIRLMLQDSEKAREHKKFEKNYNENVKILPPKVSLTTNLVIIPRRLVIQQLISPITTVVIENKSIIQMHKEMFEIMWDSISD